MSEMKLEYDFSKAARGKFYRPNTRLHLPVYLNDSVSIPLSAIAERKGITLDDLVNDILKRELDLAETLR